MGKNTLNLICEAAGKKAVVKINGSITGWKNSAEEFEMQVEALIAKGVTDCDVYLNTGGGSVFEANEIANIIKRFKGVISGTVGAICASAGTVILCACKIRKGSKNSQYMIHKPSLSTFGNEDDHQSSLKLLQNIQETILDDYSSATGLSVDALKKLWQKDYWMTAKEALQKGFITEILEENIQVDDSVIDELIQSLDLNSVPASVMMNLDEYKKENSNLTSTNFSQTKTKIDMEIKLIASMLKLDAAKQTEQDVTLAVQELVQSNEQLKLENKTLKDAATAAKKTAAESLIDDAIVANKLKANERDEFVKHALENFDLTKKLLDAKTAYSPVTGKTETGDEKKKGADVYADWSYERLWKEAPKELARIKAEEPDRHKSLFDQFTKR